MNRFNDAARAILVTATLLLFFHADGQAQTTPPVGADLLKTDILAVLAHPDDETIMAATVARYALVEGKNVAHVYCTRGEGGGNMVGTQWGPALGILREQELRDCLATLGIRACYFLDQVDWAYTESATMTLEKWDREIAVERLTRLIRCLRPEVVLTMSPFPRPGWHGHHQAAGMLAVEATAAAADPQRYPMQITREGLTTWLTPKVYYRGSTKDLPDATQANINTRFLLPGGGSLQDTVRKALSNHRSQGFGRFTQGGGLMPPESFVRLLSNIATNNPEDDLLSGFDDNSGARGDTWLAPPPTQTSDPNAARIAFEPRPAVTNFLKWAKINEIDHFTGKLQSDIPVVRSTTTAIELSLDASGAGTISFSTSDPAVPPPATIKISDPTGPISIQIETPSGQTQDFELTAEWNPNQSDQFGIAATTTLHPVPLAAASPVVTLAVNDPTGWNKLPEHLIPPSLLVQGKVDTPQDCRASFRIAHDAQFFFTEVTVTDDAVVSNIAPNDIRGHWRSDSIEICLDPGGSEHTLTCFKLGIFPFDSSGNVRAARDADAQQGPVEETSPGTQLFSERLPDGYRIRAAIPLADARIKLTDSPTTIGFNIIIYDGDKSDAAPGENINQARIAWSPRSGIQGRPEDWGRLVLNQ
ncbi:MAG: LmbE family N-acetylglucosaminyl deacetylase [Verrucomicrobiales bacterium]|jgi:LmbE family N-acetylglucosaminyl deacetylase